MAWAHDASLVKYCCVYTFVFIPVARAQGSVQYPLRAWTVEGMKGSLCGPLRQWLNMNSRGHERITLWTSQAMAQHEHKSREHERIIVWKLRIWPFYHLCQSFEENCTTTYIVPVPVYQHLPCISPCLPTLTLHQSMFTIIYPAPVLAYQHLPCTSPCLPSLTTYQPLLIITYHAPVHAYHHCTSPCLPSLPTYQPLFITTYPVPVLV